MILEFKQFYISELCYFCEQESALLGYEQAGLCVIVLSFVFCSVSRRYQGGAASDEDLNCSGLLSSVQHFLRGKFHHIVPLW